jgi:putative flippase GtrA
MCVAEATAISAKIVAITISIKNSFFIWRLTSFRLIDLLAIKNNSPTNELSILKDQGPMCVGGAARTDAISAKIIAIVTSITNSFFI